MNYILIVIASVLLITGIVVGRGQQVQVNTDVIEVTNEEVDENIPVMPTDLEKKIINSVLTPTPNNSVITITPETTSNENKINDWIYPGSVVVSKKDNSANLKSTDSDETVTSWYKEKISSKGMSVNSFVTTRTNGNIVNKLVGSDGSFEVKVDIKKAENEEDVGITIELIVN